MMFIYVSLWDFMEDMLVQGRGLPEIKKEIMKQFDVGFREADRLVRTEAAYVLNKASVQRYREAGLKIIQWSTGPEDGKECEICAARSDKVYLIDEAPLIPAHPNCRCVYAGVVELSTEDIAVDGPEAERKIEAMQAAKGIKPLKNTAESGTIKARDEEILKQIRSSETNKNLNVGNQNKHIRSNRGINSSAHSYNNLFHLITLCILYNIYTFTSRKNHGSNEPCFYSIFLFQNGKVLSLHNRRNHSCSHPCLFSFL